MNSGAATRNPELVRRRPLEAILAERRCKGVDERRYGGLHPPNPDIEGRRREEDVPRQYLNGRLSRRRVASVLPAGMELR